MQTRLVSLEFGAVSFLQINRVLSADVDRPGAAAVGPEPVEATEGDGAGSKAITAKPNITAANIGATFSPGCRRAIVTRCGPVFKSWEKLPA